MRPVSVTVARFLLGLRRPSKRTNARRLAENAYAPMLRGPGSELRERQWREAFAQVDASWFCLVIQRPDGALIGFAKGGRGAAA